MPHCFSKLGLLGALAVGAAACTTPSVPIPPPEPEKVFFALDVDSGQASFRYAPFASYADAVVYVFNRDVGEGIITTAEADGSVQDTEPFPALEGDQVVITFETDEQLGSTCVTMQDGQSSSSLECSL